MSNKLTRSQKVPFSVLFPDLHAVVCNALKLHFPVLQLPCLSPLLSKYADVITHDAIDDRHAPESSEEVFINLEEVKGRDLERVDALVIYWRGKVAGHDESTFSRAMVCFPKIYYLARDQILLKENYSPLFISSEDLAVLTMLLAYVTTTTYRGHDWISNQAAFIKTFECWFVET